MFELSLEMPIVETECFNLTKNLQKGLVIKSGRDFLCEEGMGFGVPVIVKDLYTYLSYSALEEKIPYKQTEILKKTFYFDAIKRIKLRGKEIENTFYYNWIELRGLAYKKIKPLQKLLRIWSKSQKQMGFEFFFKKIEPLTKITVYYHIGSKPLQIKVDLSEYKKIKNNSKVFILNEQGASNFTIYKDSDGNILENNKIGGWNEVRADKACFYKSDRRIGFCLKNLEKVKLYRGWEYVPDDLSWSGLIYDLGDYKMPFFKYSISIET